MNDNLIFLGFGILVGIVLTFPAAYAWMPRPTARLVAWRKHNGHFWAFQKDVPQMRDAFKANGWIPLYDSAAAEETSK